MEIWFYRGGYRSFEPKLGRPWFAGFLVYKIPMCHDSATKLKGVNIFKNRLNFLWHKNYPFHHYSAKNVPQISIVILYSCLYMCDEHQYLI